MTLIVNLSIILLIAGCTTHFASVDELLSFREIAGSLIDETNLKTVNAPRLRHKSNELNNLSNDVLQKLLTKAPNCKKSINQLQIHQKKSHVALPKIKIKSSTDRAEKCHQIASIALNPIKIRKILDKQDLGKNEIKIIKMSASEIIQALSKL